MASNNIEEDPYEKLVSVLNKITSDEKKMLEANRMASEAIANSKTIETKICEAFVCYLKPTQKQITI